MNTLKISASLFAFGAVLSSAVFAQDTSISMENDGTVILSGLSEPGQDIAIDPICDQTSQGAVVACMADIFLNTLDDDQKAQVLLPMTAENAASWSNLPCGSNCRVGLEMTDMTEEQRQAALGVVYAASNTGAAGDGYSEITALLMADDVLTMAQDAGLSTQGQGGGTPPDLPEGAEPPQGMPDGGPDGGPMGGGGLAYSSNNYFIAFLGEPSATETWQFQFGGHHLGTLHTYAGGEETSATPNFIGIEPKVWIADGVTYDPLTDDRNALAEMLASFSADQLAAAELDTVFSDVLLGPGKDGQFPDEKVGIAVSELDDAQKALVLAAIREWVGDTSTASADAIMAGYEAQLDETYVAFSGSAELNAHANYVRIDGPGVWLEFVCQNGVIFGDQIHYHTIWRDHVNDYGAVYDF